MRHLPALALGLALLVAPLAAAAEAHPSAAKFGYFGGGCMGALTVTSAPGDQFIVRAQSPDGNYIVSASGQIPESGSLMLATPAMGPHNDNQPQFIVEIHSPLGAVFSVLASGPSDGNDWYWD